MKAPSLSVVIPAWNEERRLAHTVLALAAQLRADAGAWDLCVVDDGSTDGTAVLCERLRAEVPQLRCLVGARNHGKGHAVRRGMLSARGDLRVMCDADGSMPAAELPRLLGPLLRGEADLVIGSRYVEGADVLPQPAWRRAWSRLCNAFAQRRLVPGIRDIHSGYKAFTGAAAERLFGQARLDGWAFDLEVLALAIRSGLRVEEVGITWRDDAESKVDPVRDLGRVLRETRRLERNLARGVYAGLLTRAAERRGGAGCRSPSAAPGRCRSPPR